MFVHLGKNLENRILMVQTGFYNWGPPCLFRKSLPVEALAQAHLPARPSIEGYGNCEGLKFQCCNELLNLTATPVGLFISAWMIILVGKKILSSTYLYQSVIWLKFRYSPDCIPEVWLALIYSCDDFPWKKLRNAHLSIAPLKQPQHCSGLHQEFISEARAGSKVSTELFLGSQCTWPLRWYCWWKKSCTTWDVQNLVNNGINYYLPTGAGFLPSTVWLQNKTKVNRTANSLDWNHIWQFQQQRAPWFDSRGSHIHI